MLINYIKHARSLRVLSWILSATLLFLTLATHANPTLFIPEPLVPWKGWVLKGYETALCPPAYNNGEQHFCFWSSELNLVVTSKQTQFSQKVVLTTEGWINLPGDKDNWPQEVKVNGKLYPVVEHQAQPAILLAAGEYLIEGICAYSQLPDYLSLPTSIGTLIVSLNGKMLEQPDRDKEGRLWLKPRNTLSPSDATETSLSIIVFRLIEDTIPLVDNTRLILKVTGSTREVDIGPVLQPNTVPLSIESPLPSRLEENGILHLQIKPGVWEVIVRSRYLKPQNNFSFITRPAPWPSEEVWSLKAESTLRLVEVEGVSLDPTQTTMPAEWRNFPAYLMKEGQPLTLIEKRRGQIKHPLEQIHLQRTMWLDFSGKGYTLQDVLTGNIEDAWRLSLKKPYELGRVTVDNQDKLITQLTADGEPGVEIRQGALNLRAVSSLPLRELTIPAVGWNMDVQSLATTLFLPPGWILLGASGADIATHAWLQQWSLLDLFIVLIIAAATFKLAGRKWGIIALFTLTLIYQEPNAPIYSWLMVIGTLALVRALPFASKAHKWVIFLFRVSLVMLIVISLPFMVQQVRGAIYPQLSGPNSYAPPVPLHLVKSQPENEGMLRETLQAPAMALANVAAPLKKARPLLADSFYEVSNAQQALKDYDPQAKIQTGPGLPTWSWNVFELQWNGPVTKNQTMKLWILPSGVFSLLKLIQVIFMGVLIYGLARLSYKKEGSTIPASPLALLFILSGWMALTLYPNSAYADYPSEAILEELRNRLVEAPSCLPDCADLSAVQVNINEQQLNLRLKAQALSDVAIPLPSAFGKWMPRSILLNNEKAIHLKLDENQTLWLELKEGVHEIVMEGPISSQKGLEITFPLLPKKITIEEKNGWEVNGVQHQQLQSNTLYFTRLEASTSQINKVNFESGKIPPFVILKRTLHLGLEWEVTNELLRVAPQTGQISMPIPLLKEEAILTDNLPIKEGKVWITLNDGQANFSWNSKLPIVPTIELHAAAQSDLKEIWQLDVANIWHCQFTGLTPIQQQTSMHQWLPSWQPWPKEKLIIEVTRPQAVPGPVLTIDESRLSITPGKQETQYQLNFVARTSQGTNYSVQIPPEASMQEVLINERSQPINANQGIVTLPLNPGSQKITLRWQSPEGMRAHFKTPVVRLGETSTNSFIQTLISKDRWILYLSGPLMGPAVLFWGIVIVVIGASVALGRSKLTPLKGWEWFLLASGLTIATPLTMIIVVGWFIAVQQRKKLSNAISTSQFQWVQIGLIMLTLAFLVSLFSSISEGLLGLPQMQLAGPVSANVQSYFVTAMHYDLMWYQDHSQGELPQVSIFSLPLSLYRILMLMWALWLAFSLVKWMRWGWECFSQNGYWRNQEEKVN